MAEEAAWKEDSVAVTQTVGSVCQFVCTCSQPGLKQRHKEAGRHCQGPGRLVLEDDRIYQGKRGKSVRVDDPVPTLWQYLDATSAINCL